MMEAVEQHGKASPRSPSDFILKLYGMLEDRRLENAIRWSPDGREICIRNRRYFEQFVLPNYYRHNKLNSFVRQLNNYGFRNVSSLGSKRNGTSFRHECFVRGQKELLKSIRRQEGRQNKKRDSSSESLAEINDVPAVNTTTFDSVMELGAEIMGLARKQPQLASQLTGIFDKVSRLVLRSSQSIKDLSVVDERRSTISSNMLQTLKDFLPTTLKFVSVRSFDLPQ